MVEGFAILFVVVVSLSVYLIAWFGAREHSARNPGGELVQLTEHREVLRQKIGRGQTEHWDSVMMLQLEQRLTAVEEQIERLTGADRNREAI